jgi:SAM-dependent methyltransferase
MLGHVSEEHERERLAATFDQAADRYQRARPDYPEALFDRIIEVTGLSPGARLLEVGCATGKATLPLARRGFRITCVEPGAALAAACRGNLSGLDVEVVEARFEDWRPAGRRFDLVFAATAWHWVDPAVGYRRAAEALRPGGFLAVWAAHHVIPYDGDPFFEDLQEVYDEIGESLPAGATVPRPQELDDDRAEIEASGLFEVVDVRQYDWETTYDAEGYIDLLHTFSGHIAMQDWQRDRLFGEIRRRLARRPDGLLRRHWGGVLHIARRRTATGGGAPADHVSSTRAAYDAVVDAYAQLVGTEISPAIEGLTDRALLDAFARSVSGRAGRPVADIGCGPGRVAAFLATRAVDVVGVDLSPAMLAVARAAHPAIGFAAGRLTDLPFPDRALAGAVCWYSIINTPPDDLAAVGAELARVLAPGGRLLVGFQAGTGEAVHHTQAYGRDVALTSYRHAPDVVADRLTAAGLRVHARVLREPEHAHESSPQACLLAEAPPRPPRAG